MNSRVSKALVTAAALLALSIPATARAQTVWDLGALAGSGGGLSTPFTFTNGALGSITGYVTNALDLLYSKDFGSGLSDSEHGIGLCLKSVAAAGCNNGASGDFEIGDFSSDGIVMDVNLAPGNQITGFRLASVQAGEGWKVFYATTGVGTCNASTSFSTFYSGTGPNVSGDFATQATNADCFKFVPGGGTDGTGKDYLLETFTTEPGGGTLDTVTPEPASMLLMATGLVGLATTSRRRRRNK